MPWIVSTWFFFSQSLIALSSSPFVALTAVVLTAYQIGLRTSIALAETMSFATLALAEQLGIVRFAALPPVGQLAAKYRLRHRWLGPLLYPRYIAERVRDYGRGMLKR